MEDNCFTRLYRSLFLQQCESAISICINPLSFKPPSHPHPTPLGCHRAPGWAPCAIQQLPTRCLFYIWQYIYVYICQYYSLNSSHPFLPSLCPQASAYVCVSILAMEMTVLFKVIYGFNAIPIKLPMKIFLIQINLLYVRVASAS